MIHIISFYSNLENILNMPIQYALDHYKTLGLERNATQKEIKSSYHQLALDYHPDKNNPANKEELGEQFIKLTEAYTILKNNDTRKEYDENQIDPGFAMFVDIVTKDISIQELEKYLEIGANIDAHNLHGQTSLMYAVNRGKVKIAAFLIEHNASINNVDDLGNSPLIYAAVNQSTSFSIDSYKIYNQKMKFENMSEEARAAVFEAEMNQAPSEPEPPEPGNKTAFREYLRKIFSIREPEAIDQDKTDAAKLLLENGANATHVNDFGDDALAHAGLTENILIFKLLQKHIEQINSPPSPSYAESDHIDLNGESSEEVIEI